MSGVFRSVVAGVLRNRGLADSGAGTLNVAVPLMVWLICER
jgi:hypothetical protein